MRCYNGCPDKELQALLDEKARIRAAIQARGYHATYFPNGEFYMAFDARPRPVTGECKTLAEVLRTLPTESSA